LAGLASYQRIGANEQLALAKTLAPKRSFVQVEDSENSSINRVIKKRLGMRPFSGEIPRKPLATISNSKIRLRDGAKLPDRVVFDNCEFIIE
jgi:hypothetical protein